MDITAISTTLASVDTSSQVGVAVLAKSMDAMEEMGDGMKKMMEMSVNPMLGANIDVSV